MPDVWDIDEQQWNDIEEAMAVQSFGSSALTWSVSDPMQELQKKVDLLELKIDLLVTLITEKLIVDCGAEI